MGDIVVNVPPHTFPESMGNMGYRWALEDWTSDSNWQWIDDMWDFPQRDGYARGMIKVSVLLCQNRKRGG